MEHVSYHDPAIMLLADQRTTWLEYGRLPMWCGAKIRYAAHGLLSCHIRGFLCRDTRSAGDCVACHCRRGYNTSAIQYAAAALRDLRKKEQLP